MQKAMLREGARCRPAVADPGLRVPSPSPAPARQAAKGQAAAQRNAPADCPADQSLPVPFAA
jgi:hypothetical protein